MLTFITTMSIDDFKSSMNAEVIEIKKSLRTGKPFFIVGGQTGAVSERFVASGFRNPVISHVESRETGDTFWLLHNRDEGAQTLASL